MPSSPQDFLIGAFTALISAAGGFCVAVASHFGSDQRERLNRQYQFKEKQISEFYGPLLAMALDLTVRWELLDHLKFESEIETRRRKLDFETQKAYLEPVHRFHEKHYLYQNETLKKMCTIVQEKLHLAEPSTQMHLRSILRFTTNFQIAASYGLLINRTGQLPISSEDPFPSPIKEFFEDLERQHNKLLYEVELSHLTWIQRGRKRIKNWSMLKKPLALPKIQVNKIDLKWGSIRICNQVIPGNLPAGTRQISVPIVLVNHGTMPIEEYFLEVRVPTQFLVPTVKYALASSQNETTTVFVCTHKNIRVKIPPGESSNCMSLEFTITPELSQKKDSLPATIDARIGVRDDVAKPFTLCLDDLKLFPETPDK